MADSLRTTIDKKEEEAKEKAKAAANNQKSSNPETKINVPKNLLVNVTKTKKVVEIKKDNNVLNVSVDTSLFFGLLCLMMLSLKNNIIG